MAKFILILFVFLISCINFYKKPDFPLSNINVLQTYYVDDLFTDDEIELIHHASLQWERLTNGKILFSFIYFKHFESHEILQTIESNILLKIKSSNDYVFKIDKKTKSNTLGFHVLLSNGYARIGVITDRIENEDHFQSVVAHELGHSLGLNHIDIQTALMFKETSNKFHPITEEDGMEFCRIYKCNYKNLKFEN